MDNPQIADRLDAFALLLQLVEANPHAARAYRGAAETIRGAAVPVAELVRSGRARELRGIGPGIEARLRELVESVAVALDGEAAGDVRRWRDSCERLAVVCAASDPYAVLARFAELAQIVALLEQSKRRAVGVTVEGVPVELVALSPALRDGPCPRDARGRSCGLGRYRGLGAKAATGDRTRPVSAGAA